MIIETTVNADKPQGAPFHIEQTSFGDGGRIDAAVVDLEEDKLYDWPMVYILANEDEAYVGQTTSVVNRMSQHGANPQKKDFNQVNIIFNEEFNSSVVTDYEHRIIQLMHADGKYQLTNRNDGMSDSNYFSKQKYGEMFEELWVELQKYELAEHSIADIEESEVFKYSPFKSLTVDQKAALDKILIAIKDGLENARPIVVEGMPGTGKTILATFLLKALKDDPEYKDLNIRLVEPPTSLRGTLQKALAGVSNLSSDDVIGPGDLVKPKYGYKKGEKSFDIVLVDEAHRLHKRQNIVNYASHDKANKELGFGKEGTQLDWILAQAKLPIFFYDPLQVIGPSGIAIDEMKAKIPEAIDNPLTLDTQMRVKGGKGYLHFVDSALKGKAEAADFANYEFVIHDDFKGFCDSFEEKFAEHDMSRMIAGYAWPWATKKDKSPEAFDIEIGGVRKRWNCQTENWVGLGVNNLDIAHEVGCIHSIQGYDLSYAYVIVGNDIRMNPDTGEIYADRAAYFDTNGKNSATPEELNQYIKNIYYVLLTRGIYGTHVYVCDPVLRDYLKKIAR